MTDPDSWMIRGISARLRRAALNGPWLALLLLCSGLSLGADCLGFDPSPLGTPGLLGNYARRPDAPLASGGAHVIIEIEQIEFARSPPKVGPWVRVTSTNPAVLSAMTDVGKYGEKVIAAQSGIAGKAELQLFDAAGKLIERFPVEVKTPTQVVMQNVQTPNVLFAGSPGRECPQTMAGQDKLMTGGTLRYAVTGTLSMLSEQDHAGEVCSGMFPFVDNVWFTGTAGQGEVTVTTAEGLVARQAWKVVTASDVASITIAVEDGNVRRSGISQKFVLVASARTKEGELINAPICSWSAADPAVRITGSNPKKSMYGESYVGVILPKDGSFTVTCTIGSVQGTAQLVYPPF